MSKDLKDSIKEVGDKVDAAVDQGKEKIKDTADKAKDSYQDIKKDTQNSLNDLKNKTENHFSSFQDKAEDFASTAEDEFNRLYGEEGKLESLVNFVRDRPILSVGVAAIVGVIVTKLLKCCCHKKR